MQQQGEDIGFKEKKHCNNCATVTGREEMKLENDRIQARLVELRNNKQWIYAL